MAFSAPPTPLMNLSQITWPSSGPTSHFYGRNTLDKLQLGGIIFMESCDCGGLCWAHLLVFSPHPLWPGHVPTKPFSPLLQPLTRKPKAMIPRLRFLLQQLGTSWQRPKRIAKHSQKISKRSLHACVCLHI